MKPGAHPAIRVLRVVVGVALLATVFQIESCSEGDGAASGTIGWPLGWGVWESMSGYAPGLPTGLTFTSATWLAIDVGGALVVLGALEAVGVLEIAVFGIVWAWAIYLAALLMPFPFWALEFPLPPVTFVVHVGLASGLRMLYARIREKRRAAAPISSAASGP